MIVYKQTTGFSQTAVRDLYEDANWSAYTKDMPKLMRAISHSLAVITAWDGETLVGLVRAVGDSETILYIQDIIVLAAYKRRGIGTTLLNSLLEIYPHVRQRVLLTDSTPETRGFYEANGFQSCDKGTLVAFAQL